MVVAQAGATRPQPTSQTQSEAQPEIEDASELVRTATLKDADAIKEHIDKLDDEVPPCAERTLSRLLYHFQHEELRARTDNEATLGMPNTEHSIAPVLLLHWCTNADSIVGTGSVLGEGEDPRELVKQLQEQLCSEKLHDDMQTKQRLQRVVELFERSAEPSDLRDALQSLLLGIRPVNLVSLRGLIEQTKAAAEIVKGKDIVLLLGGTGSGKSTTILFLAGVKLVKQRVHGLVHIGAYVMARTRDGFSIYCTDCGRARARSIHSANQSESNILLQLKGRSMGRCHQSCKALPPHRILDRRPEVRPAFEIQDHSLNDVYKLTHH